jgi:hypothetical protein
MANTSIAAVMGLVGQRDVQRDDVSGTEQLIDREQADMHFARALRREIRIVADDLHAERACQLRDVATDAAKAHDAHGLAAQLGAFEALAVPFSAPHGGRGVRYAPHQRQQQTHRVLTGADGIGAGRIHHGDAAPGRRWDVDGVDAGAGPRDHAQVRRMCHQARGDTRFAAHDERVRTRDRLVELRRFARDVDDFDVGGVRQ